MRDIRTRIPHNLQICSDYNDATCVKHVLGRADPTEAHTMHRLPAIIRASILIGLIWALTYQGAGVCRAQAIEITSEVIGPPLVGFGAQMNPYLYCHPNWGSQRGDVNEDNVKDLEAKVIALSPQYVRVFVQLPWFSDQPDDEISRADPRIKDSCIRTIRLAQRAGASVNLSLWFGFWRRPEQSMRKFADILSTLVNDEHLTAIRYVTIGNESNDHEDQIRVDNYNRCYLALDAELRRVGLREQIKIISGGLTATNQERWFANLAQNLSGVSDGYSVHIYWDYWDTQKMLRRVSEVPGIVHALPPGAQKPLYVGEFGVRGVRQGSEEPGYTRDGAPLCDTSVQATQIAWFMMEALNRGYVATDQWDCYDAWYDVLMHFGLIGDATSGWQLRPAYHVLRLFTHTTNPGTRAVRVKGDVAGMTFAATRSQAGDRAIYLLNRTDAQRSIEVGADGNMFETRWSDEKLFDPQERHAQANAIKVFVPPMSLIALTTRRPEL